MTSLIMTVLNEREVLPRWFKSIALQTKRPDEIIIVDGGSSDETWEYLLEMSKKMLELKVYREPGNIAHGRNFAIRKSTSNLIVVTDAGCVYSPNWFEKITEPFADKNKSWSATGFGPWFEDGDKMLSYLIASSTTPAHFEFSHNWLPSSRSVAFLRDRWQTAGGYPEWIPFCEDVLLDLKLLRKEGWPILVREPLVFWRPRTTLSKYFKQLYNYTRSEGHAVLNTHRQVIRYTIYLGGLLLVLLSIRFSPFYLLPIIILAPLYCDKFWKRWLSFTGEKNTIYRLVGMLALPFVVAYGDIAKMLGYLVGSVERFTKLDEVEYFK